MANIKSQKKRIVTNEQARQANKAKKSRIATEVRKFREQVTAKDFENANKQLQLVFSLIDRARLDNVYHANTASRKKANLAKLLSDAQKPAA
ncbi:MAG: 30S ribosomal protein S20 [Clostridia bacterium]|nr:30S ribosomal protein S20 [Clostridia bacterium]